MAPAIETRSTTNPRVPETLATNSRTAGSGCRVRYSEMTGTKDWENAPSANRRRSRLGIRKATKNASVPMPAPPSVAMKTSRM